MRTIILKAALLTLTCVFATEAMAQRKYISTRMQMDQPISAETLELYKASTQKKKKKKAKRSTVYQGAKLKGKRSQFSNDINYAVTSTGAGASQNTSAIVLPTESRISTRIQKEKPVEKPASTYSGSVDLTIGHDSDFLVDRQGIGGTFFEIKPGLSYSSEHFGADFSARIKDFTKQENSDQAKETEANVGFSGKFNLTENIKSTTKLSLTNSDARWPDWFGDTLTGQPIRYFQAKIGQSIGFKQKNLSVDVGGSYLDRNFSNDYTDNAPEILGARIYGRDYTEAQIDSRVAVELSKVFTLAGRPVFKHRLYKDEPARQTNGLKGGAAFPNTPMAETMTAEMNFDVIMSLGPVSLTPSVTVGQDADRALGANDTSYSGGALNFNYDIDKDSGLKLTSNASYKAIKYDNWTLGVVPDGDLRSETEVGTGVGASVNLTKSVGLAVNYASWKETSNLPNEDENFRVEVVSSTLTVSF